MVIGQEILVKHDNVVKKGRVKEIYFEELDVELDTGEIIRRKFWEVQKVKYD